MKKSCFFIIVVLLNTHPLYCQQGYWQQQVNYKIDVTLDDKLNTLDGFVKLDYFNNSPDTLSFIWFHLWPNAYKNDRTAFSDQQLVNGRTDFYFSNRDQRGYINRLDFKVAGAMARVEDHPAHQDIIKLLLPSPLAPGAVATIQTPFHVQLPFNFSRGGYNWQTYQITQWYPKPAVYDRKGWHPMPYLDQGEFYSEFGNYEVQITLPENYVVAATGELQDVAEKKWLSAKAGTVLIYEEKKQVKKFAPVKKINTNESEFPSSTAMKTIRFVQQQVHDFAWFADKRFVLQQDTLLMPDGRVIDVAAYWPNMPDANTRWKNSINRIKQSIRIRNSLLGDYPYNTITAVEAKMGLTGGMEYPTIICISPMKTPKMLLSTIEHEVGHQWLYGILASNERQHPWMDEGITTYYDQRSTATNDKEIITPATNFFSKRIPSNNLGEVIFASHASVHKDQPIETAAANFSQFNYLSVAYYKTSRWLKQLEQVVGTAVFDSCMHEYYRRWKMKHPYPEDFRTVFENVSGRNLDKQFDLLNTKGVLDRPVKRPVKFTSFFNLLQSNKYRYVFISPLIGYNKYDKLLLGLSIHNYTLPQEKFKFLLMPLVGTGSKKLNGAGRLNYHWIPLKIFERVEAGLNANRFSTNRSKDTTGKNIYEHFYKVVPYFRLFFKQPIRSNKLMWLDIRTYIIGEKRFDNFDFIAGSDSLFRYPKSFINTRRYINQLSFNTINARILYPYSYQLQLQQGEGFYRLNVTGYYFFNYAKGGGMSVRVFAAKFGNVGSKGLFTTFAYRPKLLGANGTEDYTYSSYFAGRSAATSYAGIPVANDGAAAQQIAIQNTGGLKLRLDPFSVQGQSENWIAAINFSTSLPSQLIPPKIPLKLFFDAGTYAEAWEENNTGTKFLYVGGLQLSLLKNVVNIYAPLFYSKVFKEYLKTDKEANRLIKKITFSIDLQQLHIKKMIPGFSY